jgi:hypothetical protein
MTGFDPAAIELVVAFLAPLAVSVVKQAGWPDWVNGAIALIVYVVAGVLAVAVQGQPIDANNIVPTVTLFTTVGTVAYQAFWSHTGLETALTEKTSVVQ